MATENIKDGPLKTLTHVVGHDATGKGGRAVVGAAIFALAALTTAADKLAYYTAAGVAALTDISAHARAFLALSGGAGKFPRSTGTSTVVMQDIVGTVSQSSGVPTGGIVEKGSNANGDFVRHADGTQMCWFKSAAAITTSVANGVLFRGTPAAFTFPAAFVGAEPLVSPAGEWNTGTQGWTSVLTTSLTDTNLRVWSTANDCQYYPGYIAVGRWF